MKVTLIIAGILLVFDMNRLAGLVLIVGTLVSL